MCSQNDNAMSQVLSQVAKRIWGAAESAPNSFEPFLNRYSKLEPENVSWLEVCADESSHDGWSLMLLVFVDELLERRLYNQEYSEELYRIKDESPAPPEQLHGRLAHLCLCGSRIEWVGQPGNVRFSLELLGNGLAWAGGYQALNIETADILRNVAERFHGESPTSMPAGSSRYPFLRFFFHYATKKTSDITWEEVCSSCDPKKWAQRYSLQLIVLLLKQGLYKGDHRHDLERLRAGFEALLDAGPLKSNDLLCGNDIESVSILHQNIERGDWHLLSVRLESGSEFLKKTVCDFLQSDGNFALHMTTESASMLLQSFEEKKETISSIEDFTSALFWKQALFMRQAFVGHRRQQTNHIAMVKNFYLYLISIHPDHDFFSESLNLSYRLLNSPGIVKMVVEDFYVTTCGNDMDFGDCKRVAIIMRGYESLSTTITNDDFISFDVSNIRTPLYRQELLAYACSTPERLVRAATGSIWSVKKFLQFLEDMKGHKGYPNPSVTFVSDEEIMLYRQHVEKASNSASTATKALHAVRTFLRWQRDERRRIDLDRHVMGHLMGLRHSETNDALAIPDEELVSLGNCIAAKAEEEAEWLLVLAIFHVLLQTEFRVSQVCHLTTDCIKPSIKPGQYLLCSPVKGGHGEVESFVITEMTKEIIQSAMKTTSEFRNECATQELSRYIFLYKSRAAGFVPMNAAKLSSLLKECCRELGFAKEYTAANIRDTHMTKALIHACENGEMEAQARILTGHKSLNTTMRNYFNPDIRTLVEATCDIIISDGFGIDAAGKVVELPPEKALDETTSVEKGCGQCTARKCISRSAFPCLTCDYFVTTIAHEKFFVRAIESLDAQIEMTGNRHEIDDLITKKRLHALYLEAIYQRKVQQNEQP